MREAGLYLIPAIHSLGAERERDMADEGREEARLARLLGQGRLKEALFRALTSRDRLTRRRFEDFREFLRGAPLYRPRFDPVQNPDGTFDLQEDFPATDQALSLDLAGLGVQHLYAILASIMLSGAPIIGLEEPEVHLHGPTSGAHLRRLLRRLVDEGRVQQMFIATHSNLFDLDPTGYWEVRLDPERGTVVERRPLADLDGRHLYEPGPARHALLDMLKFLPVDQPVFRRADGSAITGPEMIQMLQEDSPEAFDFLRDVSAAAVRAVQVRARKAP